MDYWDVPEAVVSLHESMSRVSELEKLARPHGVYVPDQISAEMAIEAEAVRKAIRFLASDEAAEL